MRNLLLGILPPQVVVELGDEILGGFIHMAAAGVAEQKRRVRHSQLPHRRSPPEAGESRGRHCALQDDLLRRDHDLFLRGRRRVRGGRGDAEVLVQFLENAEVVEVREVEATTAAAALTRRAVLAAELLVLFRRVGKGGAGEIAAAVAFSMKDENELKKW
nr:hypothetical protein Iba_chr09dCG7360 [Ipomoea batatas]